MELDQRLLQVCRESAGKQRWGLLNISIFIWSNGHNDWLGLSLEKNVHNLQPSNLIFTAYHSSLWSIIYLALIEDLLDLASPEPKNII